MKLFQYLTITFLVLAFCALQAGAADLKIIANPSVGATSVSAEELKGVFLATKSSLSDGSHVTPVLEKDGPVHESFLKEVVGKPDSAFGAYFRSLVSTP
jgi:hypothetical protein